MTASLVSEQHPDFDMQIAPTPPKTSILSGECGVNIVHASNTLTQIGVMSISAAGLQEIADCLVWRTSRIKGKAGDMSGSQGYDFLSGHRTGLRCSLALLYAAAGVLHLVMPAPFLSITPGWVPAPAAVIFATGLFEVAAALGLLLSHSENLPEFCWRFMPSLYFPPTSSTLCETWAPAAAKMRWAGGIMLRVCCFSRCLSGLRSMRRHL